ncbi:MAG: Mur ligase family protein [Chloroflexi bacterium]|nr:Mur ligase family protein [Chloroflexota bacterium]
MFTLAEVIEALTCTRPAHIDRPIAKVIADSRQAQPGVLFIALPGKRADGHNYVGDAFHRGASMAIIQRDLSSLFPVVDLRQGALPIPMVVPDVPFCLRVTDTRQALGKIALFWRRKQKLHIAAIIGSVDQSSTKEYLVETLSQRYPTLSIPKSQFDDLGLPLTILQVTDAAERIVIEVDPTDPIKASSLIGLIEPSLGLLADPGYPYPSSAGYRETIARSVDQFLQTLPSAPLGVAILNRDDPHFDALAAQTPAAVLSYGLDPLADIWADEIESQGVEGIRFRVHLFEDSLYLRMPLIGNRSVHTALQVAAVGLVEGLTWHDIAAGLQLKSDQLHLATIAARNGATILEDTYNASLESTLAALNLLGELEGRKIAVIGDMVEPGSIGEEGRQMVGARAAGVVQELVTVGEEAKEIASAAKQAGLPSQSITWVQTAQDAIDHLHTKLNFGDVVLVKGAHGTSMDCIAPALAVAS